MNDLSLPYRALRPLLQQYASLDRRAKRVLASFAHFADGLVTRGLSAAEQSDLTLGIYSRQSSDRSELFDWEPEWYRARLPPAPARVLLGAAGNGREVGWLRAESYAVDAFEPSAAALPALARAVGPGGSALCGEYRDLVCAARGRHGPLRELAGRRYDAIILGWGSLSHVLDSQDRADLFDVCHELCPRGPILASFWFAHGDVELRSRARALGAQVGDGLAWLRGLPHREGERRFVTHVGVGNVFTLPELEALGNGIGRTTLLDPAPYPHACWPAPHG